METTKLNTRKIIEIILLAIICIMFCLPMLSFIAHFAETIFDPYKEYGSMIFLVLGLSFCVYLPVKNLLFTIIHWYAKEIVPHIWQILNNILTKPRYCIKAILILFGIDCLTYLIAIESFEGFFHYEFVSLGGATGALLYFLIIQKISDVTASNLSLDEKTIKQLKPLMLIFAYPIFPIAIITIIHFIFSLTV